MEQNDMVLPAPITGQNSYPWLSRKHTFKQMKAISTFTMVLAITLSTTNTAKAQETLTNQSMIDMVKLGFGDPIILSKIKTSNNNFDLTTNALMELKKNNVTDAVISAMMEGASDPTRKVIDMNDHRNPHRPGVYYYDEKGMLVELLPTVASSAKTRNTLGAAMSYGIAKAKVVSQVPEASARKQFNQVPKFYFYFNQQTVAFDQQSIGYYGFTSASSPSEFLLVRMDVKKGVREVLIGSANNYTSESGIDQRQAIHFELVSVAPGIFEVSTNALGDGEYCFLYSGIAPSAGSQQKVYDFGVHK